MPSISLQLSAASSNALEGLQFSVQDSPALVSLYAASPTEGESLTFSVGSRQFIVAGVMNVETGTGVVNTDRDILLDQEVVPAGKYFLDVPTVTANMRFLLVIEPSRPSA